MRATCIVVAAVVSTLVAAPAHAVCFTRDPAAPDGWDYDRTGPPRTFDVSDEFARASIVATVSVTSSRQQFEDRSDPQGLTSHLYGVHVTEAFKGPNLPDFTIHNGNTSARFDMEVGKTYHLFVLNVDGRFVVDACGWSDQLTAAAETLSKVRVLSATTRPPPSP